jgi:hypothetical protein
MLGSLCINLARWVCALAILVSIACQSAEAALGKRQIKAVESKFLPAYYRGDTLNVLKSLSDLMRRMTDEKVDDLDEHLAKHKVPPSGEVLVRARLALLRQNAPGRLPKTTLRELLVTIAHIKNELEGLLVEAADHPILGDKLPSAKSLGDYEQLLWNAHVMEQRLITAQGLAKYGVEQLKTKRRHHPRSLSDEKAALLETDFAALGTQIEEAARRLNEREIEVRIERLRQANDVLSDSLDVKNRFIAAWAVDLDGDLVRTALVEGPFRAEALNDEALAGEVADLVIEGRELAGDLLVKSRLLHEGLHWWLRGRYGKGTDGFGLLKSQMALHSEEAQFALYMPTETPKPTDPSYSSRYQVPQVDRRHNYVWAWEYRQVSYLHQELNPQTIASSRHVTQETELSNFY